MGFVLVGHSRGASKQLTTATNLRTTSSWHDLYIHPLGRVDERGTSIHPSTHSLGERSVTHVKRIGEGA